MFPIEIWEKILQEIKCPKNLGRLKLVCMDWNTVIEKILQRQISWDNYCSRAVTEQCMVHLVNQITEKPEKYTDDLVRSSDPMKYNEIWREVYCYWKTWPLFIDHRMFIYKLSNLSLLMKYKRITHIDVYRDYIGIVTNDNLILFYKVSDLENIYYKVYNPTTTIVQFTFWKTEKADLLALTRSITGDIKFYDIILKIQGGYGNKGDFMSIYLEKCYILNGPNVMRVIYINSSIPILVAVSNHVANENPYQDFELLLKLGSSHYLCYNLFSLGENQPIRTNAKFYTVDEDLVAVVSDKKIWFLTKQNGAKNWQEYDLFNILHGKIQYLCYHCNLLIFGLDSGTIYIFHLKKKSDLECFDFSPANGTKIIVDTKPIIAIRVVDFKKRRIIAAATHENVHFINFLPK